MERVRAITKHPGHRPAYRFVTLTDKNIFRYIKHGPSYRIYELDQEAGLILIGQSWMGEGEFNFNLQSRSYMGPVIICGRNKDGFITDLPFTYQEMKARYPELWKTEQ